MTAAIPFLMLAFWDSAWVTPTPLALVAQASGWLATAVWCVMHLLFVAARSVDRLLGACDGRVRGRGSWL